MSRQISNYGDLKQKVKEYLNKDNPEVVDQIPTFIALAERKIYRQLRCPANEKIVAYPMVDGVTITKLQIPEDYLESKMLTKGSTPDYGTPLNRISEQRFYSLTAVGGPGVGEPRHFARVGNAVLMFPIPDASYAYQLYYWADFSGTFDSDAGDNQVLKIAPDLYLYGALIEAQPYMKNDERIAIWSGMFTSTMDIINNQSNEAEYSGSNVAVSNAVGGAYGDY